MEHEYKPQHDRQIGGIYLDIEVEGRDDPLVIYEGDDLGIEGPRPACMVEDTLVGAETGLPCDIPLDERTVLIGRKCEVNVCVEWFSAHANDWCAAHASLHGRLQAKGNDLRLADAKWQDVMVEIDGCDPLPLEKALRREGYLVDQVTDKRRAQSLSR